LTVGESTPQLLQATFTWQTTLNHYNTDVFIQLFGDLDTRF